MKIIDSKGKLFGFVNIIDAGVILLLLALVLGGAYRFSGSAGNKNTAGAREVVLVDLLIEDVRQVTVNAIAVGDITYDPTSREVFGEIIDIHTQPHQKAVETSDGKIVMAEVPNRYDIKLVLKSNAHVSSDAIKVASHNLRVGTRLVMQTRDYAVTVTVLAVAITK